MYLLPVFILLGLLVGSFLNVCIDRLPQNQSIIRPPSHCSECKQKLKAIELIPMVSYLWLRGRCRYCGARIPLRLPIVEGTTSLLFTTIFWRFGLGPELTIALIYACLFTVIFVIDLEHQLILNKVVFPGMALAIAFSFLWPGIGESGVLGANAISQAVSTATNETVGRLVLSLMGGTVGFVCYLIPYLLTKGGMGFGDVKLGALVGLATGYPLTILAVLLAWIGGGLVAIVMLVAKRKRFKDPIPSGTFLAVSAMVVLLWGQSIWEWYL